MLFILRPDIVYNMNQSPSGSLNVRCVMVFLRKKKYFILTMKKYTKCQKPGYAVSAESLCRQS